MKPQSIIQQALDNGISLFVDNGKLGFKMAKGAQFPNELKLLIKNHKAAVIDYFEQAKAQFNDDKAQSITKVKRDQVLPLSFAQQRMWFIDQLEQGSAVYNMPLALEIKGQFEIDLAQQAINHIVARHETLRTRIVEIDNQVQQHIDESVDFQLQLVDLRALAADEQQQQVTTLIAKNAEHVFDLANDLMIIASFIRCKTDDNQANDYLLFNVHHIASDGWSLGLLLKEFGVIYQALQQGNASPLPPLAVQYADFAHWQRQHLQGEVLDRQLAYWATQLADLPQVHALPLDHARGLTQSHQGGVVRRQLPVTISNSLEQIARLFDLTPFMLLHASIALLFTRHSYNHDIVIGTPVAGRKMAELDDIIGLFVNTLVLRVNTEHQQLADYFAHVRQVNLDAQAHQDIPFEQLVEQTQVARTTAHTPLFQILFSMNTNDFATGDSLSTGFEAEVVTGALEGIEGESVKFDMDISARFDEFGLAINWLYDKALFNHQHIERMCDHLSNLLTAMVEVFNQSPAALTAKPLAQLDMLSADERTQLIDVVSRSEAEQKGELVDIVDSAFYQRFEQQVKLTPKHLALRHVNDEGDKVELSYQQLNRKANQWAAYIASLGAGYQSNVGLCLNRGLDMVVAILAIHKLGACYVSLDPNYPQSRLQYIVEDTALPVIMVHQSNLDHFEFGEKVAVAVVDSEAFQADCANLTTDDPPVPAGFNGNDLASIIYTSGSTGKPKGVMVTQRNIMALIDWGIGYFSNSELSCVFAGTSLNFDLSIFELFTPLTMGGSCVIAESILSILSVQSSAKPDGFDGITLINTVPSTVGAVVAATEIPASVETVITCGEPLTQGLAQRLYQQPGVERVVNLYGPTEDTVYSTCSVVKRDASGQAEVPNLGKMLPHGRGYVVDIYGQLAGIGCIGQLMLAGEGLTRGYWGREQLTNERFIQADQLLGIDDRIYASGDLVYYHENGLLHFISRVDQQVKIRGFRIELGEIESQLLSDDGVSETVVMVYRYEGHPQLAAYVVPRQLDILLDEALAQQFTQTLLAKLAEQLPHYMVPSNIVLLEQMPYMPNGKLDKKALPAVTHDSTLEQYVAPTNDIEQILVNIWAEVLRLDAAEVSTQRNFFALGGDSILSIQVVSRAKQQGLSFTIKDMFNAQTISQLALVAEQGKTIEAQQDAVTGKMPLLPIHQRFFGQPQDLHHYNQAVMLITPKSYDFAALFAALSDITQLLVQHHDSLRLSYQQLDGQWQGEFLSFDFTEQSKTVLEHKVFNHIDEISDYANQLQSSLSLQQGQLFKAVYFAPASTQVASQGRLLLLCHHLLVDGVSWRILLEDINQLYQQLLAKQPLSLSAKTSSYQSWGLWLSQYRHDSKLLAQVDYWSQVLAQQTPLAFARPQPTANDDEKAFDIATATMQLSEAQTKALLEDCGEVYRSDINELLLAGLALAYQCTVTEDAKILSIELEGHGREALADHLDVTRTVGWFTSVYPLNIALPATSDDANGLILDTIQAVKRCVRQVPDNGFGYGVLEQDLQASTHAQGAELVFNYLGQFDQSIEQLTHFAIAEESTGQHISSTRYPSHPMALNGLISANQLKFSLSFDGAKYPHHIMQQLMENFAQALEDIVIYGAKMTERQQFMPLMVCDFPLAQLSDEQFAAIELPQQANIVDIYPATKMQQGLLFHSLLTQGQYVTQMEVRFVGLDISLMQQAWQSVVAHNDVFRTGFIALEQGNAHQLVYAPEHVFVPWQSEVIADLTTEQQQARVQAVLAQHKQQGFEQAQAPLMRVAAFDAGDHQRLVWSFHHALVDGWSLPLVFGQLVQSYHSLANGEAVQLAPVKRYRDHVQWLMAQDVAKASEYWQAQLAGVEGSRYLPLAKTLPEQVTNNAKDENTPDDLTDTLRLNVAQSAQLQALAQSCNTTVNVIVQGAWALLMSRHSGQQQVVFGAISSGRPAEIVAVDKMIGLFINTLPVVVNIEHELSIKAWLSQLHQGLIEREAHSYLPLADILKLSASRDELFDSLLVFENYPVDQAIGEASAAANLQVESVQTHEGTNYGLTLLVHFTDELSIRLMGQQQRYDQQGLAELLAQLKQLLLDFCATIAADSRTTGELQLLSREQQQQLLAKLNRPAQPYQQHLKLHQWFELQAAITPNNIALSDLTQPERQLSYAELNQRANRLARLLQSRYFNQQGNESNQANFVGICLNRGIDAIIAILAVLKAGGCYVPLDPNYPQQRLAYIAKDSQIKLLLAERNTIEQLTGVRASDPSVAQCLLDDEQINQQLISIDYSNLESTQSTFKQSADSILPAYVIYTSGSTGQPKGVAISHHNAAALLHWAQQCFDSQQLAKVLASTSFNFDLSIFEIFAPLAVGGQIVVADSILQLAESTAQQCQGITLINTVPSGISALLAENAIPASVTTVNLAGEPLPRTIVAQLYQTGHIDQVYNLYGPSEDTTYSLASLVPDDDSLPLIGQPITNTMAYVVDNSENIAALGIIGELYLAGDGVALGYLHRDELTEQRFIDDPFAKLHQLQSTNKAYKTGDLVRYRAQADGQLVLEFIGRVDNQVKLRGFRIEPGEVEHQLNRFEQVESALVVVDQGSLAAFVLLTGKIADQTEWLESIQQQLAQSLPAHMVPSRILIVDAWPLTPNGKIDKAQLLEFAASNNLTAASDVKAPQSDIEHKLLALWAKLLRIDGATISTDDNFLRLGGDSILSLQMVSQAMREGMFFTVKDVFEAPTIAQLAVRVSTEQQTSEQVKKASGEQLLLPIQQFFAENLVDWHHYNQAVMLATPADFSLSMLRQMVQAWMEHHDVLRLVFEPNANNDGLTARYQEFTATNLAQFIEQHVVQVSAQQANLANSQDFADSVQASLNPTEGVLFKAVLVKDEYDVDGGRLLIVMHHLIVDGVSWRVLIEQLLMMYQQIKQAQSITLPTQSNSYQQWSLWLAQYAERDVGGVDQEIAYWQNTVEHIKPVIANHGDSKPSLLNSETQFSVTQFSLDASLSEQLLGQCNHSYRTQVNELLLAGIFVGVAQLTGCQQWVVGLEGHGRETLDADLDISQTLGWFTSLYPLLLSVEQVDNVDSRFGHEQLAEIICAVKEQYRGIPHKGIGYGALKYLAKVPELSQAALPELLFNYLGQFEQLMSEQSDFYWASESTGRMVSTGRHSQFGLTINGLQTVEGLSFTLSYDQSRYSEALIEQLVSQVKQGLISVAEHCTLCGGEQTFTPSDFPLAQIDSKSLNQWQQHYDIADLYPASGMQQGLLFQSMLHQGSYTNQKIFTFVDLDVAQFNSAWQQVIANHAVFRTGFVGLEDGNGHQLVVNQVELPWYVHDLTGLSTEQQLETIEHFRQQDKAKGFDITQPPLMRINVFELGQGRHQLLWSVHHALLDGWCLPLVFAEVTQYYRRLNSGEAIKDLTPNRASYKDYIAWLAAQDLSESRAYWSQLLADFVDKTPLPFVDGNGHLATDVADSSHSHSLQFDEDFSSKLNQVAKDEQVTLNVLVQGAWAIILSQYHLAAREQNSVVFGAVTSGRPPVLAGVESIVGLFINSIPIKVDLAVDLTLSQWFKAMQQNLVEAESHAHVPLKDIQSLSPASEGLFDSLLVFENYPVDQTIGDQAQQAALNVESIENFEGTDDAMALVVHTAGQLSLELTIGANKPRVVDGEKIIAQLESVLTTMVQLIKTGNSGQNLAQIQWLNEAEQQALLQLAQHNSQLSAKDYQSANCDTILRRFEQVVAQHGDNIAIYGANDILDGLSYQQLDHLATHFARALQQAGVSAGQMVGICAPRSQALIVAMLATMKLGCAYVPLSADSPVERLSHQIADTELKVALVSTTDALPAELAITAIPLDWDEDILTQELAQKLAPVDELNGHSLAYVMYTSGSTGVPKGVKITHRNVMRCVYGDNAIAITPQSRVVYCANPVFDASTWEIWVTLLHGASLVVVDDQQLLNVDLLRQRLVATQANVLQLTAGLFRQLAQPLNDCFKQLDYLLIGGDKPDISAVKQVVESGGPKHFIHTYGPTETVAFTTVFDINHKAITQHQLPIGRATFDSQTYILDHHQRLVPHGAVGLLHIGGTGVADGYLNRDELSAKVFIDNPFAHKSSADKLYNTGDLVKLNDDGDIVFVGRLDEQVKIRGYRIELGEIEHQLNRCDGVKSSLVRVDAKADKRLLAYVEQHPGFYIDEAEIKQQLKTRLPDHMLPAVVITIDTWPLTANGKIDVAALPAAKDRLVSLDYQAPNGQTETQLQQLWAELLQLEPQQVSTKANFFALGGDSILSIQLVARAAKLGLHFSVKDLFDAPTIVELALLVSSERQLLAEQGQLTGQLPLLPVQQAMLADSTDWHHVNQSIMLETTADFDPSVLPHMVKALYQQHDALRISYGTEYGMASEQEQASVNTHSLSARYLPLDQQLLDSAFESHAITGDFAIELTKQANSAQRSLDPANGRLFKLVYFYPQNAINGVGRLLLVVHHLAIDGVSWRILLDDIQTLYQQHQAKQPLALADKTTSYRQWGQLLESPSVVEHFNQQLDYWQQQSQSPAMDLVTAQVTETQAKQTQDASAGYQTIDMSLSADTTQALLTLGTSHYRAQINELLLAALLLATKRSVTDEQATKPLLIELESHGREVVAPLSAALDGVSVDLSQTVGWFTQSYPLSLNCSDPADISAAINQVKTQYRQVPDGGLGYGILKYMQQQPELATTSNVNWLFNYLGQNNWGQSQLSNADETTDGAQHWFKQASESVGTQVSERRQRLHDLSFNGMVTDGALWFEVSFNNAKYQQAEVNDLLGQLKLTLEQIVAGLAAGQHPLVAVDFPYASASDADIANWQQRYQIADLYQATGTQQGLLFHSMLHSGRYVTQTLVYLQQLDIARFEQAWQLLIAHHDILRTAFVGHEQGQMQQLVVAKASAHWQLHDWSGLSSSEVEASLQSFLAADKSAGFDSEQAPLLRFNLFDLGNGQHCLLWSHHHAIMDGWSLPLIFAQFRSLYAQLALDVAPESLLASLPQVQYGAYAKWLTTQDNQQSLDYWSAQLAEIDEVTPLPMVSTQVQSDDETFDHQALQQTISLSEQDTTQLVAMAKNANTTVGVVLQAAWACLLSVYTGREQVVFGATTSGRPPTLAGVEQMVGLFINTLPVSVDLSSQTSFMALLGQMHQAQAVRELHSHIPLVEIQRQSKLKQNLFETIVVFENYPTDELDDAQLLAHDLQVDSISFVEDSNFGLNLVAHLDQQLSLQLMVHDNRFVAEQVNQLLLSLQGILQQVSHNAEQPWRRVCQLEQQLAPAKLTGETKALSLRGDLASQFEHQAKLTPDGVALVFGEHSLSYAELDKFAERFAAVLMENDIEAGQLVGLYFNRSITMVVSLLAVAKLGAAFVALEPSQPHDRIAAIVADANLEMVITSDDLVASFTHRVDMIVIEDVGVNNDAYSEYDDDELPQRALTDDDLAYVLYTSGSSGTPKGVKIKQQGLLNYLDHGVNQYMVDGVTGSVVSSPLCFDATLTTLLVPLMCGGSVELLADEDSVLFEQLASRLMTAQAPLLFKLTPAHLTVLLAYIGDSANTIAHRIVIGGEQLTVSHLAPWLEHHLPHSYFINEYGPTETVVGCCIFALSSKAQLAQIQSAAVPIGLPIQNTQLYVTNSSLQLLPQGAVGELLIAGHGVCAGYLNRQALSEQVLLAGIADDGLAYRTGDLVLFDHHGQLEFIGRNDEQVKVNGYRIELSDIEYQLNRDEQVEQALVHTWHNEQDAVELVAYVQLRANASQDSCFAHLNAWLASQLPSYMCPQHFVLIEDWPLTVNGKVNRRGLPAPEIVAQAQLQQLQPSNPLEQQLLTIWQQALKTTEIGVTDAFFQVGGDSILALTVIGQARQQGINITVSELLQLGSIRAIATHLNQQSSAADEPVASELAPFALLSVQEQQQLTSFDELDDAYPQTLLQQGMIFQSLHQNAAGIGAQVGIYHDISTVVLKLQWDQAVFTQALTQVVARHDALRAIFVPTDYRPLVLIQSQIDLPLLVEDWRHLSDEQQQLASEQWLDNEKRRAIALDKCPWQIAVQRLTDEQVCFHISFHHALLDGWSRASLETELFESYHQLMQPTPSEVTDAQQPLPFRYFVDLELQALGDSVAQQHWSEIVTAAPMPWWNGAANRGEVYQVDFVLDKSKAAAIATLTKKLKVQEKSVLMALHVVICGLLDGQTQVLTSSVYNTRPEQLGSELTLGLFLNALPLSVDFADLSWAELIETIDAQQLAGFAHRYYPVTDIQQRTGIDLSGSLFNFVDFHVYEQVSQSADLVTRGAFDRNNYWLQSAFERGDEGSLSMALIVDSGVFDPTLFKALEGPIQQLVNDFAVDIEQTVPTSLTPQAAKAVSLAPFTSTDTPTDEFKPLTVWQQFEQLMASLGSSRDTKVAIHWGEQQMSYAQLATQASIMAEQMTVRLADRRAIVALHCQRQATMVVAMLAASKAGVAYVPLDIQLPQERKTKLVQRSNASLLLTDTPVSWLTASMNIEQATPQDLLVDSSNESRLATAQQSQPQPHQAAYIIFTSGSTGEPKGVEVSHGALSCHLAAAKQRVGNLTSDSRWLAVTTLSFDIAGLEIFAPILAGAELILADEQQSKDPQALADLMVCHQVSHMQATPATWTGLIDSDWSGASQLTALCGGEALTVNLATQLRPRVSRLYNCYGPTEATIWSMIAEVEYADLDRHQIELTGTLAGYAHGVVNQFGQPVPMGVPGQLCIAGLGLANGYFADQALTDKAFIARINDRGDTERWYLTGDNVIQTGEDSFTYLGRIDYQVKVNGHRVELGEIQYQANACALVRESVVTSYQDSQGFTLLALYLVPELGEGEMQVEPHDLIADVRAHLAQRLPRYMVPSAIVTLDALPLNSNGKVDIRQLEKPQLSRHQPLVAPSNEIEQQLAEIWSELLSIEVEQVSINDDFFLSGGHSLLVIQLLSRVRKQFGFEIELAQFMANGTIAALGQIVAQQQALEAVTQAEEKSQTLSF